MFIETSPWFQAVLKPFSSDDDSSALLLLTEREPLGEVVGQSVERRVTLVDQLFLKQP